MARLDLDDLPPRIANLLLGLDEGGELLIVQHGGLLRRFVAQSAAEPARPTPPSEPAPAPLQMRSPVPPPVAQAPVEPAPAVPVAAPAAAPPAPPPPISSPAVEQQTRDIFESFRAAIEDEF